ncbi:MAG: hypothetical protein ACHP84_06035 [Caulobacterales bacterium]
MAAFDKIHELSAAALAATPIRLRSPARATPRPVLVACWSFGPDGGLARGWRQGADGEVAETPAPVLPLRRRDLAPRLDLQAA